MENINEGDKLFLFTDKNNEESVLKIKRLTDGDSKLAEPNKKFCSLHNIIKATCALCDITTCFKCLFSNKESIDHYYEHFDSIDKSFEIINLKDKEDPLANFEKKTESIFDNINKAFDSMLDTFNTLGEKHDKKFELLNEYKSKAINEIKLNYQLYIYIYYQLKSDSLAYTKRILNDSKLSNDEKINQINQIKKIVIMKLSDHFAVKDKITENLINKCIYFPKLSAGKLDIEILNNNYDLFCNNKKKKVAEKDVFQLFYNENDSVYLRNLKNQNEIRLSKRYLAEDKFSLAPYKYYPTTYDFNFQFNLLLIRVNVVKLEDNFLNYFWRVFFGITLLSPNDPNYEENNPYRFNKAILKNDKKKDEVIPNLSLSKEAYGIFFQSNGWVSKPRSLEGDFIKVLDRPIREGDSIYFYIDTLGSLFIGVNETNKDKFTFIGDFDIKQNTELFNFFADSNLEEGMFTVDIYQ